MNVQTTIVCRKMTEQWQKWLLFFWWGNFSIVSFYIVSQLKRTLHKILSLQSLLFVLQQTKEIVTFCLQRRIDVKTFLFSTSFSFFFYSSVKGTCLWDARTTFLHVVRKDILFLIIFKLSIINATVLLHCQRRWTDRQKTTQFDGRTKPLVSRKRRQKSEIDRHSSFHYNEQHVNDFFYIKNSA